MTKAIDKAIKVWIRVKHGKRSVNDLVLAGRVPKTHERLSRKAWFAVKARVREEFLKTGRIVPTERVVEIVEAMVFAEVLS